MVFDDSALTKTRSICTTCPCLSTDFLIPKTPKRPFGINLG